MANRIPLKDKSKTFTSFNLKIPFQFRVCGNLEFEKDYKETLKEIKDKSTFIFENIRKDLGKEDFEDFLDGKFIKEFDNLFWENLLALKKLSIYPTKQHYLRYIIEREKEKQKEGGKKSGRKKR